MPETFVASIVDIADARVIANQVVAAGRRVKPKRVLPHSFDLSRAIADINQTDTIRGSSTLDVSVIDPAWILIDSHFFDADKDGKLEPVIDIRYPEGSQYWWRLTQVSVSSDHTSANIVMTFMERLAARMAGKKGAEIKISRAKMTRAQFIKHLVHTTDRSAKFVCTQLTKKQPQAAFEGETTSDSDSKSDEDKRQSHDGGINSDDDSLTVQGAKINSDQIERANTILGVAEAENAGPKAAKAMMVAVIQESQLGENLGSRGTTFQTTEYSESDLEGQAKGFLTGGKSFQGGGAIKVAKDHPDYSAGEVAVTVEAPGSIAEYASKYDKWGDEANAIIEAYGTLEAGDTETYRKAYNFIRAKGDDNWQTATTLADEVQWYLFVNGNYMHYDTGKVLIKQKPIKVIKRGDADLISLDFTWDSRKIATEMTLELFCKPDDYRAGEVFKCIGFGTASMGKHKGAWLISEISGSRFAPSRTFTLEQPMTQKKEPAPESGTRNSDDSSSSSSSGAVLDDAIAGSPIPGQQPHASTHQTAGLPGYPAYDYMAPAGTPVVAPVDGKVPKLSGHDPATDNPSPGGAHGYSIYIDGDDGNSYFLTHLDKVSVDVGDTVKQGQQIAEVADGPASWSSPHCHMGVKTGASSTYGTDVLPVFH